MTHSLYTKNTLLLIDIRPTIIELPHVEGKSSDFIMLKSVAVFLVPIPDCMIMFTKVSSHSSNVSREGAKPSTDEVLTS